MAIQTKRGREEVLLYPKMLLFYRNNPVFAVRDLLGITLTTHQRIDLRLTFRSDAKDIIRLFGRGMSKTFGEAVHVILNAILFPGIRILVLAGGGFRQGKMIMEEIERIIKCQGIDGQIKKDFVFKMLSTRKGSSSGSIINKDPDMWRIKFKHGSTIATAPIGSKGDAIRGFRANITQVDERKDLKKEIKQKVLKPFTIVEKNVITQSGEFENVNIDSGTLEYAEDDYTKEYEEFLRQMENGNDRYMVIKFIYPDAFNVAQPGEKFKHHTKFFDKNLKFWKVPYGIKVDDIESEVEKATTDFESWRAEHLCMPMRATGDYYSFELMEKVSKKSVLTDEWFFEHKDDKVTNVATQFLRPKTACNDPCILGVDCGREGDFTSFTVIRMGQISDVEWDPVLQEGKTDFSNIIWSYQERHMHDPDAAIMIYDILEMFPNILIVALDKRGGGTGLRDQLYHVVKDRKVEAEILFDPEDDEDNGIATLVEDSSQNNRLRLLTYSDKDNTRVNRSIRNAFKEGHLFLAGGDELDDELLNNVQKYISLIPKQFRMIKTKPTANWLKFYVESPKNNKKDLYSSTIYAWGEVINFVYQESIPEEDIELATIAPTFSMSI